MIPLCDHYSSSSRTYYDNKNNCLYPIFDVDIPKLTDYLKCKQCQIITPTILPEPLGRLFALGKTIYYLALSRLTTFLALHLPQIYAVNQQTVVKIARLATILRIYHELAQEELKGYALGNAEGRAHILNAHYSKMIIQKFIYTQDYREVQDFTQPPLNSSDEKGNAYTADEIEEQRAHIVQHCCPFAFSSNKDTIYTFKRISFATLIQAGYIQNARLRPHSSPSSSMQSVLSLQQLKKPQGNWLQNQVLTNR
jgi:hypothetical protein